jgi:hypothetical protein
MRLAHLPATGMAVTLRAQTGVEDLMLLEAFLDGTGEAELGLATALVERLAVTEDGAPVVGWQDLPVIDLETMLLRLRQASIGDQVRGEVACAAPGCGERVLISFSIEAFLRHAAEQSVPPEAATVQGWFGVAPADAGSDDPLRFRLPTPRDIVEAARAAAPERALAARCIHPPTATPVQRRRAERAMEATAPLRVRDLRGHCPACGAGVVAHFDVRWFCLRELREQAAFLYDELDLLARTYHWSEATILSLSSFRRGRYAERVRSALLAAA